jgi:prepilin-type N-terminal cleavage/methylation domain-containing protein
MPGFLKRTGEAAPERGGGYTLIEFAVVMIILGVIAASFFPMETIYIKQKAIRDTQLNLNSISNAIGDFRAQHGRYPCPSSLTADRGDPAFGFEDCSDKSGQAFGDCSGGICIQHGQRDVTLPDGTLLKQAGTPPARAWAPFRSAS